MCLLYLLGTVRILSARVECILGNRTSVYYQGIWDLVEFTCRVLISPHTCAQTLKVWIRTFIVLDFFGPFSLSVHRIGRSLILSRVQSVTFCTCFKNTINQISIFTPWNQYQRTPDGQINTMNTVNVAWSQYQVTFMV